MEVIVSKKARRATIDLDQVKDLAAQLLNFRLDRRDVTHDMRLKFNKPQNSDVLVRLHLVRFSPSNALASLAKFPIRAESWK